MEFVDIAGLVAGASKGEGLGNQFLQHIREVDAIVQVVRCFEDNDVHHVSGTIDPIRDIEVINTELVLADLTSLQKRHDRLQKEVRAGEKVAKTENAKTGSEPFKMRVEVENGIIRVKLARITRAPLPRA